MACDVLGSIFIQDTTPNDYAAILLSCGSILAFLYSGFTMCVLLRTLGWRLFTLEFWKIWISCFIDLFALCLLIPSLMFRHSQWLLFVSFLSCEIYCLTFVGNRYHRMGFATSMDLEAGICLEVDKIRRKSICDGDESIQRARCGTSSTECRNG